MTSKRDPLSELFSNVELTGLSNTRRASSSEAPLQLDIPETPEVIEEPPNKPRRPVRPPRLDPNDTLESDIENEEMPVRKMPKIRLRTLYQNHLQ